MLLFIMDSFGIDAELHKKIKRPALVNHLYATRNIIRK